jgi:hypothetical protein
MNRSSFSSRDSKEKLPLLGNQMFPAAVPYNASSNEREDEGYDWDLCMVVNDSNAAETGHVPRIIQG